MTDTNADGANITTYTQDDIDAKNAEVASLKDQIEKLKAANTNASAEASKFKKALKEHQTAEQNKAQEEAEAKEKMEKELAQLRRDKTISQFENAYLSMGYSAELAKQKAEKMADGDIAGVNEIEKQFLEARDKDLAAARLRDMGTPPAGTTGKLTKEEIRKIKDPVERRKKIEENIHLFS